MKIFKLIYKVFTQESKESQTQYAISKNNTQRQIRYKYSELKHTIFFSSDLIKASVIKIYDGDTFEILHDHEKYCIRLSAVDSPENDQPGSEPAKKALMGFIENSTVYLAANDIDPYGRIVATVYVKNGLELINVNEKMVACGHAWVSRMYYKHLSRSRQIVLNVLEGYARKKSLGLWKNKNPIPPWEWRKEQKNNQNVS